MLEWSGDKYFGDKTCMEDKAGVTALPWSRERIESPTSPKTAQHECVEEASCEKTPLAMKVSSTEPPNPHCRCSWVSTDPRGAAGTTPLPAAPQWKDSISCPFWAHIALSSQQGLCPRSWEHPSCSLCNSQHRASNPACGRWGAKTFWGAISITQLFSSKPQGRSSLLALSNYANDP